MYLKNPKTSCDIKFNTFSGSRVLIRIVKIELQWIKTYYISQLSRNVFVFHVDLLFVELFEFTHGTFLGQYVDF